METVDSEGDKEMTICHNLAAVHLHLFSE